MTAIPHIVRLGLLAGLLASAASAHAGEAVIFSGPAPQAAELARILWPHKQPAEATLGATRSIRINPDMAPAAAAPRPESYVEVAGAEPVITSDAGPGSAPEAAPRPESHVEVAGTEPVITSDAGPGSAPEADTFGFL